MRVAVRENALSDENRVRPEDYRAMLQEFGRGWVHEESDRVVAFGIADQAHRNIWVLFVAPGFEGLRLDQPGRPSTVVRVRFGRAVRAPRPERDDSWWCPLQISGLGKRQLETIPGEDSLQALTVALEFVCRVLPGDADRAGVRLQWLGEPVLERLRGRWPGG